MNNIMNVAGILKTITLDKFIDLLTVFGTDDPAYMTYNTLVSYGEFGPTVEITDKDANQYTSTYKRRLAPLVDSKRELINSLISVIGYGHVYYSDIRTISEDMAIKHLEEYGSPDYFVKISDRVWMVASLEDFIVWENKTTGQKALGILAMNRSVAYNILKMTQKEADEMAKQYMEKQS